MRMLVVALVGLSSVAHAEPTDVPNDILDALDLPLLHSELRLSARGSAPSDAGDYRDGSIALAGAVALYTHDRWRVLGQLRLEPEDASGSLLVHDQQIVKGALGVSAVYLSQRYDLYAFYAGAAIAESTATISDPRPMPIAMGLGSYRSGAVTWLYGGGAGYALGKPWVLPVAGVAWRASESWTLSVLLPVVADARYEVTPALALSLVLAVSGDLYDIANDGTLAGASSTLRVNTDQVRLGIKASYKLDDKWTARLELGAIGPRILDISDGGAVMMSASSQGAGYLSTGVSYAFGD